MPLDLLLSKKRDEWKAIKRDGRERGPFHSNYSHLCTARGSNKRRRVSWYLKINVSVRACVCAGVRDRPHVYANVMSSRCVYIYLSSSVVLWLKCRRVRVYRCRPASGGGWWWYTQHDGNNSTLHNRSQTVFAQKGLDVSTIQMSGSHARDGPRLSWQRAWGERKRERVDQQRLGGGYWRDQLVEIWSFYLLCSKPA